MKVFQTLQKTIIAILLASILGFVIPVGTSGASQPTLPSLQQLNGSRFCLPHSKSLPASSAICYGGYVIINALPSHARSSAANAVECLTSLTIYFVQGQLEGAGLDEFFGIGFFIGLGELTVRAQNDGFCL